MSLIPGTNVGAPVVPYDTSDSYPSHEALYGLGGLRTVATTTARNAIPVQRLERLCLVGCLDTGKIYRLKNTWAGGVPVDADWEDYGSGTIGGGGNPGSIALWFSTTDIGANIFFTRSNSTSIVYNNFGYTADTAVVMDRYIDPAGSDSNIGMAPGPSNAWQTPQFAISQCPAVGSGIYRIHCAAGTYTFAGIATPDTVQLYSSPQYGNTLIEFIGDEATPSNVVFDNNGTIVTHNSPTTHLRLSGIRFTGAGSNSCISQSAGSIYIHSCEFNNFQTVSESRFHGTLLYLENGILIPITNTNTGFSADAGAAIISTADVTMTGTLSSNALFQISSRSVFAGIGSNAYTYNGSVGGYIVQCQDSGIYFGSGCQYNISNAGGLCFLEDNSYAEFDEGCAVNITTAASFFDIRGNSYFKDSSDNVWTITGAPSGIILANGSQVESGATVNATDPLIKFITYFAEPNSRYAEDNRYTEKYCFTMMGTLPPGFSLNYIYEGGVTGTEVPLYIAKGLANIVAMRVYTRVANGAAHTDTYQIYVNGAAPAIPFGVTITNGNSGSYNVGTVPLVADDRVSVVFTSDPATTAQDITIEFDVRILE